MQQQLVPGLVLHLQQRSRRRHCPMATPGQQTAQRSGLTLAAQEAQALTATAKRTLSGCCHNFPGCDAAVTAQHVA
jgi:hypothetical protein